MSHPVEEIPDADDLFKWVPRSRFDDEGRPDPGVFVDKAEGNPATTGCSGRVERAAEAFPESSRADPSASS